MPKLWHNRKESTPQISPETENPNQNKQSHTTDSKPEPNGPIRIKPVSLEGRTILFLARSEAEAQGRAFYEGKKSARWIKDRRDELTKDFEGGVEPLVAYVALEQYVKVVNNEAVVGHVAISTEGHVRVAVHAVHLVAEYLPQLLEKAGVAYGPYLPKSAEIPISQQVETLPGERVVQVA